MSPTPPAQVLQQLTETLDQQGRAVLVLNQRLRQAFEVIERMDLTGIPTQSAAVLEASQQVDRLEARRLALLGELGLSTDEAGMQTVIARVGQPLGGELQRRWNGIRDLARQARRQNQAVGLLLELSRREARQALDLLRGESATPPTTYAADGSAASAGSGRPLASA